MSEAGGRAGGEYDEDGRVEVARARAHDEALGGVSPMLVSTRGRPMAVSCSRCQCT